MIRHALAALLCLCTPAFAQNQPSKGKEPIRISKPPRQPGTQPATDPAKPQPTKNPKTIPPQHETVTLPLGTIEMSEDPFRLDSVGLSMNLPVGANGQLNAAGASVSAKITPRAAENGNAGAWLIDIQTPKSRDKSQTPITVAQRVMEQLQGMVGVVDRSQTDKNGNVIEKVVQTRATIIEPIKNVIVRAEQAEFERPAARFYIRLPRETSESAIIRGYTVFQTAPGEFVSFDLATPEPEFAAARPIYEATIATARFTNASEVATKRAATINAGVAFMSKQAKPEYDAAIAALNDQWYRLAKPAPTGSDKDAEEIAYRHLIAKRGNRGEIDPNARHDKMSVTEREPGIIVRFEARYLQDGLTVDVVGVYWMSSDAKSEAWTLQQATRDPKKRTPSVVTETGAREGDQMSISISGTGIETRRIKPEVPKMGYITQVQSFLLPTMLIKSQSAGEYAFYVYQSQNEKLPITTRRDTLALASDGSGKWVLTTRQSEDRPAQISTYSESGDLVQTIFAAQKMVWTPTTLGKLADIWTAKGLPMN